MSTEVTMIKNIDLSTMTREDLEAYAAKLTTEKEVLSAKLNWYEEQYKLSRSKLFGASSEQTPFDQLSFFNEAEFEVSGKIIPEVSIEDIKPPAKKKKGRKAEITNNLPTTVVEYTLTGDDLICKKCNSEMQEMKTEIRKELIVIPAQVQVKEHIKHYYVCRSCDREGIESNIVGAEVPNPVLRNSLASPSMIAYIMSRKYVEALPLYRQEQQLKKYGVEISRQTLANWMIRASDQHLKPLYKLMHQELVSKEVLFADETTAEVLNEPGREATTMSYMWLYRTGSDSVPIILYDYQQGRSGDHAVNFLKGFKGFLHTDGYAGYHKLSKTKDGSPADVIQVGCFSHARRKWIEALMSISEKERPNATNINTGLEYCNKLFSIEKKLKELDYKKIFKRRTEEAKPIVSAYFEWLKSIEDKVISKSLLGVAVNYSLNQQSHLENYLLDGRLEISNNRAERSIKPFVIGRKNFLFFNTPRGASSSAVIYSIVETAKENGLNPFPYLEYLFEKLPNIDKTDEKQLSELLPWSKSIPGYCKSLDKKNK